LHLEETADLEAVAADFQAMLDRFRAQPLWATLASARATVRELDFCLSPARPGSRQVGLMALRGQIDLLVQDAAGLWRIVDYKSDRVEPAAVAEHARRYELQVLAYAAAARRHLGSLPAEAVLYFLRPGAAHRVPLTPNGLAAAEQRLAAAAEELAAARRSGRFQRRQAGLCTACPYQALCQHHGAAGP
jgi:ATP-dependent exoDNAse (exonuclease V) beta subunit